MDQQYSDAVLVGQRFQRTDVLVVVGIRITTVAAAANALKRVNDHEAGVGVLQQKPLDLLLQTAMKLLRYDGKVQRIRRILREVQESASDTLVAILQTQVQHAALLCGERPQGLTFGHAQA